MSVYSFSLVQMFHIGSPQGLDSVAFPLLAADGGELFVYLTGQTVLRQLSHFTASVREHNRICCNDFNNQ